uniref:Uncharacterized protein n=1 Tax=Steinernema glaseri TaxID=37863 RepID=A0A1I7ZZ43_9BILA
MREPARWTTFLQYNARNQKLDSCPAKPHGPLPATDVRQTTGRLLLVSHAPGRAVSDPFVQVAVEPLDPLGIRHFTRPRPRSPLRSANIAF